jgi:tRNA1(Val) A37 N6-methylase TrmN6
MSLTDSDLTEDAFLGGALTIAQPKHGYRAGVDPVFLAAAVPAVSGQSLLELGCGVGTASLCVMARVPGLSVVGIELQQDYARLADQNASTNQMTAEFYTADIQDLPMSVTNRQFDHVILNPPYYRKDDGTSAAWAERETALRETIGLNVWISVASKRLAPKGQMTLIQRADRILDVLQSLPDSLGSVCVCPLTSRTGRDAKLVVITALKGGKAPFSLKTPIILHRGDTHDKDGDSYTDVAISVLRKGSAWPWVNS